MTDKRTAAHVKANVGNDRDFLARFNAPGYSPFTAAKAHAQTPVYAPGYPLQRDAKGRLMKPTKKMPGDSRAKILTTG